MKKKLLSMALAGALVLSAGSASQAADNSKTFDVTGTYTEPTITVTLSNPSAQMAINPYGLTQAVAGIAVGDDLQREQLVNKVETITNASNVALAVNAKVSATPSGNLKLTTAVFKDRLSEKTNSIFAFLHMEKGSAAVTIAADENHLYDPKAGNQVVFGTKETTKKGLVTLDSASGTDKVASFKILGDVAPNPTTPWSTEDKMDFNIVFDFEPRLLSN